MLSKLGNVRREEIGNIIVESDMSYFELRQASVRRFTNAMGNPMYAYENAAVETSKREQWQLRVVLI